ncbi:Aminoacyl-tRNA synthetase and BTB:POZ domain containing protein [Dirofilaria immitis]|nr:Aminoacyl-tRNA synthetase and BTB:POZ domain containing protein [Dirofilaria immitis]
MLVWPRKEYGITTKLFDLEQYWEKVARTAPVVHSSRPKSTFFRCIHIHQESCTWDICSIYNIRHACSLNGYNVIHPIGWDAFGLPAENAAREVGVNPAEWTATNINVMRQQLLSTGIIFDWNREISTCSPNYYRWTQWIFCRLFEHGLIRRALAEVHWDPVDCTVLAAEQIDMEGRSWRSGAIAEKRKIKHWMIETPKYAKRMYDGLKKLTHWKEVAAIQADWIGKCDVWRFLLPLKAIKLFTTKAPAENGILLNEKLDLRIREPYHLATATVVFIQPGHPLYSLADENEEIGILKINALNIITGKDMHIMYMNENVAKNGNGFILNARLPCDAEEFDKNILRSFGLSTERSQISLSNNDVIHIAEAAEVGYSIPILLSVDDRYAVAVTDDQLPVIAAHCKYDEKIPCEKLPDGFGYWEKDTLDTFFDSNMPVDVYVGGIEHVSSVQEPFDRLLPQGIVCSRTFKRSDNGKYLKEDDVVQTGNGFIMKENGCAVVAQFEKMSKSKHNGIDPLSVLKLKGIDLTRLQLLNEAAPREAINWGDTELKGLFKFMERTSDVVSFYVEQRALAASALPEPLDIAEEKKYRISYNFFVRNISMVIEVLHLHNTAVDHLQGFVKFLKKIPAKAYYRSEQVERCVRALVIMMQLFTPHLAAEYWAALCSVPAVNSHTVWLDKEINEQSWPQVDPDANIDFMINVGKLSCGRIEVPRLEIEHLSNEEALQYAINDELNALGFRPVSCKKLSRSGLYVLLEVQFNNIPPEDTLFNVLKQTRAQRLKAKRARKRHEHEILKFTRSNLMNKLNVVTSVTQRWLKPMNDGTETGRNRPLAAEVGYSIPILLSVDDRYAVAVTDDQLPVIAAHCKYDEKIPSLGLGPVGLERETPREYFGFQPKI